MGTSDYQRIIDDIERRIAAGLLKSGDPLPSIRLMADQYETSQSTMKVALAILRARGIVRGQQGKATYVA